MKDNGKHKANIKNPKDAKKYINGYFEIIDGELNFTCSTQNVSFEDVSDGLTKLRDELNRQIENQEQCPFHPSKNKKP